MIQFFSPEHQSHQSFFFRKSITLKTTTFSCHCHHLRMPGAQSQHGIEGCDVFDIYIFKKNEFEILILLQICTFDI